jgi:hypothetical protein
MDQKNSLPEPVVRFLSGASKTLAAVAGDFRVATALIEAAHLHVQAANGALVESEAWRVLTELDERIWDVDPQAVYELCDVVWGELQGRLNQTLDSTQRVVFHVCFFLLSSVQRAARARAEAMPTATKTAPIGAA